MVLFVTHSVVTHSVVTHSVEEAGYLGTRVGAFSARPGRVVFDEHGGFGGRADREHFGRSRNSSRFVTAFSR